MARPSHRTRGAIINVRVVARCNFRLQDYTDDANTRL